MRYLILLSSLLFCLSTCYGQGQPINLDPALVDSAYAGGANHYLVYNSTTQNNKLFLFLGGTGSTPAFYFRLCRFAGDLGYHVISLTYPNGTAAAPLGNDPDSTVFERFRQEICFGTPLSADVDVDTLNSIYTRTVKLLQYLDANRPSENWGQFLVGPDLVDWPKVVIGGHSQGAGHAPYLAKVFPVERVLMFAGPNDYNTFYNRGAPWFANPGVTGPNAHFAYLHLQDNVVDFFKQFENLGRLGLSDSTLVDVLTSPYNNAHLLYTDQPSPPLTGFHSTVISQTSINDPVWEYMLTTPILVGMAPPSTRRLHVFPNPGRDQVRVEGLQEGQVVEIWDLSGRKVGEALARGNDLVLGIQQLTPGLFWIRSQSQAVQLLVR